MQDKPPCTADLNHAPFQHPFTQAPGTAPVSNERTGRKTYNTKAQGMMDAIIIAGILFAVVPQVIYELWVRMNPDFQFSWQTRDSFFLFSVTSHLTSIVIMLASIYFVRTMGKKLDSYDEMLERGMADYDRMKSRLMGWSFDLDSFSEAMDKMVEIYHTYKKEFFVGVSLGKAMLPILPSLQKMYGERLENFDKLTPAEQREVIKSILER
jgi:hypothetical protein